VNTIITGGAGFIGSHLAEHLIACGHSVIVLDNMRSGSVNNLASAIDSSNLKILECDIRDKEKMFPHFEGVDWVFHLAGLADIVPSIEMPEDYFSTNVTGTLNVLECSRHFGIQKLIYAASSSSYGIPEIYPTPEEAPIKPQHPYALTKHMGEELVLNWARIYKLKALSLRLFNVFGPRSRTNGAYGAVFGVFLAQKIAGKPFTVVGDGTQSRDFTYVKDVANAFLLAAESKIHTQALNVGSGNHYTVNRLVELLGGDVTYVPWRPGEPNCTFADTTKIRSQVGWIPRVSFYDGVMEMLENIEAWRDAPVWAEDSIELATKSWFKHLGGAHEN
jgi:UDP-glucose 4-epimerase